MKMISLLGSTGSIGTQTLEVCRHYPERLKVVALTAHHSIELLEEQMREFKPAMVAVYDEEKAKELRENTRDLSIPVYAGMEGLILCATARKADIVVTAVVGMIGIRPTLEAIKAGKDIALANKETLVCAGHLIMPLVKETGVKLLPVDSEHSAIFQCLQGNDGNKVSRILLTASGGPFLGKKKEELKEVTPEQALKHPNWSMGAKITIDSSTMVNKGLEVMEAHWLFDVDYDQIQVVIQPKSIIHSMVEFADHGVMAQLGTPDMKLPIQYALLFPERLPISDDRLDFWSLSEIRLMKPDFTAFPALPLAYEVGKKGGNAPVIFNAANEWAVDAFLHRKLTYPGIVEMIEHALSSVAFLEEPDLDMILSTEQEVYRVCEASKAKG